MNRPSTLPATLVACLLAGPALADEFHFSPKDAPEHQRRVVEGVLLEEQDGNYRIRVEGGEISVPKALVQHIEKGGLTVAQIEQREKEAREDLALANQNRRSMLAEEAALRATARREERAAEAAMAAAEAAAGAAAEVVEAAVTPVVVGYDPVIHRAVTMDTIVDREIRRALGGEIRRAVQRELSVIRRDMRRAARQMP